jgi:hypothetical protein
MSDRSEVRVGIVGYGIMGKAHSYGYRVAPSPLAFIPSISGSNDLLVTLTVTFPEYTG